MPKIMMPIVDVREVAQAHLQAIKVPEARNKRFALSSKSLWFKDISQILKDKYPMYKAKTTELGYCPVKFASFFDSSIKLILPVWNRKLIISNAQSSEVLGIQYRDPAESIEAMAESMISYGVIPEKRTTTKK